MNNYFVSKDVAVKVAVVDRKVLVPYYCLASFWLRPQLLRTFPLLVFIPEIRSSPLVLDDGRLFIATGGGMLLSVDSSNGDVIWSKKIDDVEIFSSPKLATNGMLYVGSIDGAMMGINATTGGVVWKYSTGGPVVGTVRISHKHAVYTAARQQFNE